MKISFFLVFFLATTLPLLLTGCIAEQGQETGASTSSAASKDKDVAEAREWGRQWAVNNKVTMVTDCGALNDPEQRFGCAEYARSLSQ